MKATKQEASDHPSTTGKSKASTKKESTIGELAQESVEQPVPDEPSTTNKSKASATKESVNGKPAQEESGKLGYVASTKGSTTMTAKKNDIDKSAPEEQEQPASASMASSTKKSKASTQKESLPANVAPEDTNKPATASVASSSKKSKASLEKESAPEKQAVERTEQEASKASSTKKSKASTREEVATEKEASKTSSKKKTVATPEEALALYDSLFQDIAKVGSEDEKSDKPIPTEVCFSPKSSEADVAANALQEETPLTPPTKSSVGGTVKSAPEKVQPKLSLVKMFRTLSYRSATSSKSGKGAKIQPLEPFTIKEEPDIVICTGKVDGEIELRPSSYKGYDSLTDAKDVSPAEDIEAAVTKEESPEVQTQGKTAEPEQTESSSPEAIPEVGVSASEKKFLALSDGLKAEAKEGRDPVELARSMESDISKDWNDISKTFTVESATKITELSKGIEAATEKTKEDAPKTGEVFLPPVKGGKPPKAQKKKKQKSKQEKSKKNQLKKNQPVDDDTASCSTASDSVTHDARLAESVMKNCSACDVAFPFNGYFKKLSNF